MINIYIILPLISCFFGGARETDTFYARQPIFNVRKDTIGYELLYRDSLNAKVSTFSNGDDASISVINSIFFGGDPKKIFDGHKVYINFTEKLLLNKTAMLLPNDILVIEILEDIPCTEEVLAACEELRDSGYRLVLDDYVYTDETSPLLKYADMVKIDFRDTKENIENTAAMCRKKFKKILAEKIETKEELEYARSLGATLFQGYYFAKPIVVSQNEWTPMQATFLQLVTRLNSRDVELRQISKIIETDAVMTLKFLRFVNFMRHDWSAKITSVLQAVILAGLTKTKDFIYFVGLHQISKDTVNEVVTTGFFRAKFCESLSEILLNDVKVGEEMYLMGLMSIVVDYHFDGSEDAIKSLPLSANIKTGLLRGEGMFGDIFKAVIAYEMADWENVDAFCRCYQILQSDMADIYLTCIEHTNNLNKGIRL